MSHKLALSMLRRAAVLLLESEEGEDAPVQSESTSPESGASAGSGPANDPSADGPPGKRRKGARDAYRPQGPVDEVLSECSTWASSLALTLPRSTRMPDPARIDER